jgi:predicted Zn-dependent protease
MAISFAIGAGCVTPEYAVRPTPVPEESEWAQGLERTISAYQAREFERQRARLVQPQERLFGFDLNRVVDNLSRVTERPYLQYSMFMYRDRDPNAAALADGRVYLSTGMLNYLADRGSNESELAFILAHELAHTAAQHLVKRYRQLQQQQMMMALVGLGTAIATREGGSQAQRIAGVANDVASLVNDVIISGYSQEQELEADQLGIRYVIRAGYHPQAALALLEDFKRFEVPVGFLRTHPYIERRRQDLERYLLESDTTAPVPTSRMTPPAQPSPTHSREEVRKRLLDAQKLYPVGSQSWKNIQQQLDALER